jgi:hypothetical protein
MNSSPAWAAQWDHLKTPLLRVVQGLSHTPALLAFITFQTESCVLSWVSL